MANKINFGVGFSVDKSGLTQAVKELKEIQKISANDMFKIKGGDFKQVTSELKEAKTAAQTVEKAVQEAFNPRLNTVDFEKLNNILKSTYGNVDNLKDKLSGAGASGVNAFNNIQNSLTTLNQKMKTSDSLLDKIGKTLGNTIRWNLSSSIVNQMSGSIQEAYGYVKHLDSALNDIRIVTNKSAEEMDVFAQKANTAAQALGKSTNDYTEAALLYYQSGLDGKEAEARTEVTLKAANVTQQSAAQVSEQLTAVWNGFQITAENTERSVDKLAAIAASTASDLEELSTGMSKVAAAANTMGVSEDQLASMLSTVISVTRGAPESIGVAFKTIFARVSDIQQGLSDEFASLGNYSGKMAQFGIEILDANGKMRDMGDIIEDIGGKWETLTKEQQLNLAQTMAGQRQYSNLIALFDNWDMYTKSMDTAANSAGTLQKQQDIYMESTAAHLEQMSAALENVYDSFLDTGTINNFADAVKNVSNLLAGFIDSLGGGEAILLNLGAIATRVFSEQIANSLTKSIRNMQDMKNMANQSKVMFDFFKGDQSIFALENGPEDNQKKLMAVKEQIQKASNAFSEEELNNIQNQIDGIQELINKNNEYSEAIERLNKLIDRSDNPEARKLEYGEDYDNDYVKSIEIANEHLKKLQGKIEEIENNTKESFKNLSKGAEDFSDALKEMGIEDIEEGLKDQFENLNEEIKVLQESGEDLVSGDLIKFSKEQKKKLEEVNQKYEEGKLKQDEYKAKLGEIAQAVTLKSSTVTEEIQKEIQANEQLKQKAAEVAAAQSELYEAQNRLAEDTKYQVNLQNLNQSIVTIVGSLGQIGTSVTSVIGLFKIWGNENDSFGEKLTKTFTNLIILIPQIAIGFNSLNSAIQSLKTNEILLNAAKKQGIILDGAELTSKTLLTLAVNTLRNAVQGLIKKIKDLASAHPVLLAITVAITALVAAFAAIKFIADGPARELKRLKEEADKARESAEKLKEEFNKFTNLKNGYEDAKNSLQELRKGTNEYRDALEKVNEQAKELISLYPELANSASFTNGQIQISADALEEVNKKIKQQTSIADSISNQKQLAYQKEDLKQNGSTFKGFGIEASKMIAQSIKDQGGLINDETIRNAVTQAAEEFGNDEDSIEYSINLLQELIDADREGFQNTVDAINNENKNVDNQEEYYKKEGLSNTFYNNQDLIKKAGYDLEEDSDDVEAIYNFLMTTFGNGKYEEAQKKAAEEISKKSNDELAKQYAEENGFTIKEGLFGERHFYDKEGEKVDNVDLNAYKQALIENNTNIALLKDVIGNLDLLKEKAREGRETINEKYGEHTGAAIESYLKNGTLGLNMSQEERKSFLDSQDFKELLGSDALKDLAAQYGVEIGDEWIDGLTSALENFDEKAEIQTIIDENLAEMSNLSSLEDKLKSDKGWSGLDQDDLDLLTELENKYEGLSDFRIGSAETYAEVLKGIREQEQEETELLLERKRDLEQDEFLNKLNSIDLTLNDEDVHKQLDELGDELNDFLDAEYELHLSITNDIHDQTQDVLTDIENIGNAVDLIGEGFRVSAEDVRAFGQAFPELLSQAQILADGTLQLNEETTRSVIAAKQTEVEANAAKVQAEAQQEANLLLKKAAAARKAAQAAEAAANSVTDSSGASAEAQLAYEKAVGEYNATVQEEKAQNAASASNDEQNSALKIRDTTNAVMQDVANSSASGAASMANSFSQNAAIAVNQINQIGAAMRANQNGGTYSFQAAQGNTRTTYSASSGANVSTASVEGIYKKPSGGTVDQIKNDYLNQAGQWNQLASGFEQAAADLVADKAEMLGGLSNLQDKINNIGSGSGGKGGSGKKPSGGKGGSGKKPSGGKGGSGSAKEPEQLDMIEEEADRYHDIDIELQNIDRDLDRLEKQQKKLTGKDIINNLNKQLDILNKQVDAYERKISIAKAELAENRAALQQMGVTFGADGQIANYFEAYNAALKKYNDAVSAYNNMSAEQQEATGKAAVEVAKKEYEKFKEAIGRYDELINDVIPDLEDSIQATIDKQIEIEIEKFKMEVEVRLDMAEAERNWNEFKRKVIDGIKDDDYLGIIKSQYADLLTYFNTADTGKGPIQALTEQLNGTLDQLKSMDGTLGDWATAYGNHQAQALEDLQEYLDELMDQMMDVEDLIKDIEKTYLDMIKAIKDAFDEQLDNYKLIDDIIEHNKNVIGLLYGDKAYEQMAHYYDRQEQNNLQQLDFLRQEAAFWKEKMDAEEQGSEAWKQYKENWEDALGNLNSKVEDSIKTLIDKYTNLIDDIFDKLNNKVSNGLGLDYVKDEWDLINKNADQYLDTINRAFETQKLQEKFNEALANTSGLKAQQQIKDLMDQQLGDLEQRDKLTQYDVERAEKMLDIELKKIALQDAQQNKSKMRLRRDAQGNYSYQFVSDEQKIADAQKELAAAQNELYNFDKDRYQNNLNQIYDTYNEFQEKLKELYANTALSDEERERQKTLLIQQYGELINGLTEQNAQIRLNLEKSAFTELAKMYNTNLDEFMAMTEEQRMSLMEGLIPYWNSGIQQMVDTFAGEGGFIPTCTESFNQLEQATQDYVNSLNEIEAAAGINFDAIAQGYDKNIELAQELIVKNEELISQYDRELQAVQEVLSAVRDLAAAYASVKQNAIEASEAAMKYQQEEAKRKAEAAEEERKKQEAANKQQQAASNSSGTKPNSGTPQTTTGKTGKAVSMSDVRIGAKFRYTGGIYYYTSTGAGPVGNRGPGGVVEVENIAPNAKYKVAVKSSNSAYGWLNVNQLEKLKSGGYTGNWSGSGLDNDGGRLALLHQKELVLNSTDTQNILDAVGVLRGLSDLLGARAITNLANTLKDIKTSFPLQNNKQEEILEQQVTITATFPNVKNSNEVEDAINNLINTAAQRRNRRGR